MCVVVRKIGIIPYEEKNKNETYKILDNWSYHSWRLANDVYSRLYSITREAIRQSLINPDKSFNDIKRTILEREMSVYPGKASPNEQSYVYNISKEEQYAKEVPSNIRVSLTLKVFKDFKNDISKTGGLLSGNRSIRNYRRDGMNIYFPIGMLKKDKEGNPIFGMGRVSKVYKEEKDVILQIPGKLKFKLLFGRDRSNNKSIVDGVLSGEYRLCDSFIKKDKKGYSVFLHVDIPNKVRELSKTTSIGVDLGISIPAVCAVSNSEDRMFIGDGSAITRFRFQMTHRRKSLQRSCKYAKGGKGRNKKLKALNRFKDYESNYIKTLNHKFSKEIIDFAIKNNAGVIKMELLEGFNQDHKENIVLKNWTYYQLKTMVEYKAKREGIDVVYIDPYHTSKICSYCGHLHTNMKLEDRKIKCVCGKEYNRDYNAARNIAKSDKIVTKKEECYYNILKKKSKDKNSKSEEKQYENNKEED